MNALSPDNLLIPADKAALKKTQREGKRRAVEMARRAGFWQGKLEAINLDGLDDPAEWQKIPVLDKEHLRALSTADFQRDFMIAGRREVAEYWRSGGSTGKPLFYPRTRQDVYYALIGFQRVFACAGATDEDVAHISLPLGIHPAGHLMARAAERSGVGAVWAGAGTSLPSALQIEFLKMFKPNIWVGMSSYGIHLANVAAASGLRLADLGISTIICTAEPLSATKRQKIEAEWGAEVFDSFGMTEAMMMASEDGSHDGFRIWSDFNYLEVLHPDTLEPVAEGEQGVLVVTPLFTNNATPFLRWNTGDIVTLHHDVPGDGPFAVFPVVKHAHRTAGFFKVRGINIGHTEFEDLMFGLPAVADFRVEAVERDGTDDLLVYVELAEAANAEGQVGHLTDTIKATFELTPAITLCERGSIAKSFEGAVKPPRFVDLRG
ncbi:MAG: AMP-binding protein [Anaerolineae bacterium]|nr:AMP-binding protein [Anaerolineae bacterium]